MNKAIGMGRERDSETHRVPHLIRDPYQSMLYAAN